MSAGEGRDAASAPTRALRVGVCYADPETFWWAADKENQRTCPVCSLEDEEYGRNHRFYVEEVTLEIVAPYISTATERGAAANVVAFSALGEEKWRRLGFASPEVSAAYPSLPWRVEEVEAPALPGGKAFHIYNDDGAVLMQLPAPTAELIVRAVNEREQMLSDLQTCLHLLGDEGYVTDPDYPEVDAVLARYEKAVAS